MPERAKWQIVEVTVTSKNDTLALENPGIDPGTSRMRSGRSSIWANSPNHVCHLERDKDNL